MLYRYIGTYKGKNVLATDTKAKTYSDYSSVSDFARFPVIWAIYKGIISGMDATHIRPQGNASRAQTAAIFMNLFDKHILD